MLAERLLITQGRGEKAGGGLVMNLTARDIIIKPVITEKTNEVMENGTYTFRVHPKATKADVHNAIEKSLGSGCKSQHHKREGKPRRLGRFLGRTRTWKKAIVKLAPGQKIDFFEAPRRREGY
jgi:large subunit ribosomal protein L23